MRGKKKAAKTPASTTVTKAAKAAKAAKTAKTPAASLAVYLDYLAARSYRDGADSGDLRDYEDDRSLDVDELWFAYWQEWHRHMLYAAYAAVDAHLRKEPDVVAVMKGARVRYKRVLAIVDPTRLPRLDHERESRVFDGAQWVALPYAVPGAAVVGQSKRFWNRVDP